MQSMNMLTHAFFFIMSLQVVRSQYSDYGYESAYLYGSYMHQYALHLPMLPVYGGTRKMLSYHSTVEVPTYHSPELPTYYSPEIPTSSPKAPISSPKVPIYYSPAIPTSSPEEPDEYTNDLDNVYNPENNGSQDNTTNTNDDNDNNNFDDTNFDDENDSKNEDVNVPSPPPAKNMSNILIAQLTIFLSLCLFAMNM